MAEALCSNTEQMFYNFVYPPISIMAGVPLIIPIIIFIRVYYQKKLTTTKLLFTLTIILYFIIFVHFIIVACRYGYNCNNQSLSSIFDLIAWCLYQIQCILVLLILFIKLESVFKGTRFALSVRTKQIYWTLSISAWLIVTILFFLPSLGQSIHSFINSILVIMATLIYLFLVIWLNILFAYKLYKLNKMDDNIHNNVEKNKLLYKSIKTMTLTIVTTLQFFLFIMVYFIHIMLFHGSLIMRLIRLFVFISDLYTNFWCIFLSFAYYETLYIKICGCYHNLCKKLITTHTTDTSIPQQ